LELLDKWPDRQADAAPPSRWGAVLLYTEFGVLAIAAVAAIGSGLVTIVSDLF